MFQIVVAHGRMPNDPGVHIYARCLDKKSLCALSVVLANTRFHFIWQFWRNAYPL